MNQNSPNEAEQSPSVGADVSLGIFTVVAIILLLWGYCWLKNYQSLRPPQRINVIFKEIAGLNENASVYVDGMRVGMVDRLEWQGEHKVLVRLRINSAILKIPFGSKFEILTNGIVGAKYVQIDLPQTEPGEAHPPILVDEAVVYGEDPVRPEIAVNKLALTLSNIDMKQVGEDFKQDRRRLVRAADQLALLADKSMPVIDRALPLENELTGLTKDLRKTTKRMAKLFDDPAFSADWKEAIVQARGATENILTAIRELNTTLGDGPFRQDLLQSLQQLNQSTANIAQSLDSLQQVTSDKDFRQDLKQILQQTRDALNTVNEITDKPMSADVRSTLRKTNDAIIHLDLAAQQMNQILDKRSPLLHLMIGRPGRIKVKQP